MGGSGRDYANAGQQTADGGFVLAGYSFSNDGDVTGNHGERDWWIVKLKGPATGITQHPAENKISIYPNPTEGTFTINLSDLSANATIDFTDMCGKTVHSETINSKQAHLQLDAPAGVYFVNVFTNKNRYATKLVKE